MAQLTIKKLRYPLWFKIVFYILTIAAPLIVLLVQGLNAPSQTFRFTFTIICILLLAWIFIRKFIISNIEKKLISEKVALEHDYSIETGSSEKIKYLWFTNELWLTIINIIQIVLIGGIIMLLAVGIQNGVMKINGTTLFIALTYIVAYIIKFVFILVARDTNTVEDEINIDNSN